MKLTYDQLYKKAPDRPIRSIPLEEESNKEEEDSPNSIKSRLLPINLSALESYGWCIVSTRGSVFMTDAKNPLNRVYAFMKLEEAKAEADQFKEFSRILQTLPPFIKLYEKRQGIKKRKFNMYRKRHNISKLIDQTPWINI